MTDARKRLIKTRIGLTFDQPFFGRLLLSLRLKEDTTHDTGYTDGEVLGYNPEFIDGLSTAELKFFCCHEAMHIALLHHLRRQGRDGKNWNKACDYAINPLLAAIPGMSIPEGGLMNHSLTDKSAEQIYQMLPADDPSSGKPNPGGEFKDAPTETQSEARIKEQEAKALVGQAAQIAKAHGNMPGALGGIIDNLLNPKVPWKEVLREYVSQRCYEDYSWQRPNRRYLQQGIIMPTLYSEQLGEVCVAIDTSGSMSPAELEAAASEISGLIEDFPGVSVKVLYCDTQVYEEATETFTQEDFPVVLHHKGGGGTRFQPVFNHIDETDEPIVLLYMTDMYGDFPDTAPDYPVIWANTSPLESIAPWGTTIKMEV